MHCFDFWKISPRIYRLSDFKFSSSLQLDFSNHTTTTRWPCYANPKIWHSICLNHTKQTIKPKQVWIWDGMKHFWDKWTNLCERWANPRLVFTGTITTCALVIWWLKKSNQLFIVVECHACTKTTTTKKWGKKRPMQPPQKWRIFEGHETKYTCITIIAHEWFSWHVLSLFLVFVHS